MRFMITKDLTVRELYNYFEKDFKVQIAADSRRHLNMFMCLEVSRDSYADTPVVPLYVVETRQDGIPMRRLYPVLKDAVDDYNEVPF
jgi:hypothetical protein